MCPIYIFLFDFAHDRNLFLLSDHHQTKPSFKKKKNRYLGFLGEKQRPREEVLSVSLKCESIHSTTARKRYETYIHVSFIITEATDTCPHTSSFQEMLNCAQFHSSARFYECSHLGSLLLTSYIQSGRRAPAHMYLSIAGHTIFVIQLLTTRFRSFRAKLDTFRATRASFLFLG